MSNLLNDFTQLFNRRFRYEFEGEVVACNLCGSTEYDVVGRRDRYFGPLQTVLCRGCGLVYTNPMPTEAEVSEFYAQRYRRDYHGSDEPRVRAAARASEGAVRRLEQLAPYISEGARVVDVGSGGGEFVACLTENGYHATGLEPNRGYAEFSRREYGIDARNADWQGADFDAGSLDMITATHVLEHFRDPKGAVLQFAEWLRDGGHLYLSVPNIEVYHRSPVSRFHFAHLYNFNHQSLIMLASRAGFFPVEDWRDEPTNLLFVKSAASPAAAGDPRENYKRLRLYFNQHTAWNYYRTATPYKRFFQKLYKRFREYRNVRSLKTPKDALEESFKRNDEQPLG